MKFGKARMYKQGSHTPKPGAIPTVDEPKGEASKKPVVGAKYIVEVDKAKGKDFSGYYKPPKRKYTKKKK